MKNKKMPKITDMGEKMTPRFWYKNNGYVTLEEAQAAAGLRVELTESELISLLEVARVALADGTVFDAMTEELDITDKEMSRLRDKLDTYMSQGG